MTRHELAWVAAALIAALIGAAWIVVSSLPIDPGTAAVRETAEGAVRTLYAEAQPPPGFAGAGLSEAGDKALRDRVEADLSRYFAPDLVVRYQPMLSDTVDRLAAGSWDDGINITVDWGTAEIGDGKAAISFVEHVSLTRHDVASSPSAWGVDGAWDWSVSLVKADGQWRVASFDLQCHGGCP